VLVARVVALSFLLVVFDGSRLLYFGLARALGVEAPGGVRQLDAATLAQPIATAVVFGSAWMLARRRLLLDMVDAEAPRQAGVRRLYVHLVALLALVAVATGVGGLLQTLIELALPSLPTRPEIWREQVSLFVTLVAVGLPLWLLHWRPSPALNERRALSRRLYLFAALLGSMLALLGATAALLATLLNGLLSTDTASLSSGVSRALPAMLTAAGVAAYHWRVLRQDALRGEGAPSPEVPPGTLPPLVVEVSGATESEIRQALGHLPEGARYSLQSDTAGARPADTG
jgi:uncharacterized BrkB/YihY/UPF0761 family membrane protein